MTLYALAATRMSDAPPPIPSLRRGRRGGRVLTALVAASALAALVSSSLGGGRANGMAPLSAIGEAPRPAWVEIRKPLQLYSLASPELGRAAPAYEARRLASGAARADTLTFNAFSSENAWLRLTVQRSASEPSTAPASLFVDLARRAAEAGLSIARTGLPRRWATRFGALDVAEVTLDRGGSGAGCLGFRLAEPNAAVAMAGLACPPRGKVLSPPALVCVIERLNLNSAGDDGALRQFFTAAELRRDRFCAGGKYVALEAAPAL